MRSAVAVGVGAGLGAGGRWGVGELTGPGGFPWATLLVNLLGAALIGWAAARLVRGTVAWAFVVTGLLGGFTTASAFAEDTRRLLADGRPALATTYVAASVLGAVVATSTVRRWATAP